MKKALSLLLCLMLVFTVGCTGGAEDNSSDQTASLSKIEKSVKEGKFDTVKYGIGDNAEEVKSYYQKLASDYAYAHSSEVEGEDAEHNHNHEIDEDFAFFQEVYRENYTLFKTASERFYCRAGKVIAVSCDSTVFGFTPAVTNKYEVEEKITTKGETVKAKVQDLVFNPFAPEDTIILRYNIDDYQLDFYFYENLLLSAVIIDKERWPS